MQPPRHSAVCQTVIASRVPGNSRPPLLLVALTLVGGLSRRQPEVPAPGPWPRVSASPNPVGLLPETKQPQDTTTSPAATSSCVPFLPSTIEHPRWKLHGVASSHSYNSDDRLYGGWFTIDPGGEVT